MRDVLAAQNGNRTPKPATLRAGLLQMLFALRLARDKVYNRNLSSATRLRLLLCSYCNCGGCSCNCQDNLTTGQPDNRSHSSNSASLRSSTALSVSTTSAKRALRCVARSSS